MLRPLFILIFYTTLIVSFRSISPARIFKIARLSTRSHYIRHHYKHAAV
jgi:hypothetical protein